jgi:mono/diheme cytochrome c family protein
MVPLALLGVGLFIAFWVLLAFGLFFVAVNGGVGGTRATLHTQSRAANRAVGLVFTVILLAFGIVLPVLLLVGNHSNASGQVGGVKLTQGEKTGRVLFGQHCAVCHTLDAANAIGKVGPNLDMLKPPASLVVNTINNGCLPNASGANSSQQCLGQWVMPAGVVQGRDAQNVADFVARVAGKE